MDVVRGQDVEVGHEKQALVIVLELLPRVEGSDEMSEAPRPGGPVSAGQNAPLGRPLYASLVSQVLITNGAWPAVVAR